MKKMRDIWLFIMQASTLSHLLRYSKNALEKDTVGLVLIAWFNNCVQVKSGQIANPIIAIVDPVLYCSIRARFCLRIY